MIAYMRIACLIIAAALCGCASTGGNGVSKPPSSAAMSKDPGCLQDTGSRITSTAQKCRGFGRAYTSEDIDRTGSISAADALSKLDPAVTVHH